MALIPFTVTVIDHVNNPNNTLANTAIEIRTTQAGEPLAQIYLDEAGLIPIPQPGAQTNNLGVFYFYAESEGDFDYKAISSGFSENISGNSHNKLTNRNAVGAHDEIYRREVLTSEVATNNFPVGSRLTLTDRNYARAVIVAGGIPNGRYVLDAGNGNTAIIQLTDQSSIVDFGAISGLGSGIDNSIAINEFIIIYGRLVAPVGDFEIHNTILIPSNTYGYVWEGKGMEKTIFRCVGMIGKDGIGLKSIAFGPRVQMRDFQVTGDCDVALNLDTTGASSEIQMCHFENMRLTSRLDAVYAPKYFSSSWYNVHTETTENGHGFNLLGGNSTVLINCYAHNIAGADKAGYRIKGKADLIGCNGVDSGFTWGIFGADVSQGDPDTVLYRINISGGNAEDFTQNGIITRASGSLYMDNFNMIPPSAATSPTFQNYVQMNCSGSMLVRNGGSWTSKGSVRQSLADISTPNSQRYIEVNAQDQDEPKYEKTGTGAGLYPTAVKRMVTPDSTTRATYLGNIDCNRNYGFNAEIPLISVNTSVIDATGVTKVITQNTVATFVDGATGFVRGQSLHLMINDDFTTIRHLAIGAGRFRLDGGVNIVASKNDVYEFITFDNVEWVQVT